MRRTFLPVVVLLWLLPVSAAWAAEEVKMPYVQESKHYVVKTDISSTQCKLTAAVMDKLYEQLMGLFPIEKERATKTEIIIWEKPEDCAAYCRAEGITSIGAAYYRRVGKDRVQILAVKFKAPGFDTMNALYHEGTHEFVDMFMEHHDVPLWLDEGLAVYFESSQWKGGRLQTGVISKIRLDVLKKAIRSNEHVPLADLITFDNYEKYDNLCYAEGGSLVYFFVKANKGAYGKRLGKYLLMIKDGKDPDAAFKECFPADMKKLEAAWKQFVLKL